MNPSSVIILDEIEKAHPDVLNILLQILDDGRITDSHGKTVNFENTVIVMTTNAGSTDISASAGFTTTAKASDEAKVKKALEQFLRPEFINRVDEIVVFNRLSKDNFASICRIMLGDLEKVLAEKNITLTYDEAAVNALVEKGYSEKYGARNLRRYIQTHVEDALAARLVSDDALFFLITSYTTGLSPLTMTYLLDLKVKKPHGGVNEAGELGLRVTTTGSVLPCGASARWQRD